MRFKICRSSDYGSFNKFPPCKNAIIVEEQAMVRGKKMITKKHWEVDINTLEELLELQTEVENPLIISSDESLEIEIYNDWRE